ncbi:MULTISPECIES: DNA-directed RNA polymerase subunit beta [unclassified Enterococcus]|uniref:DNA-directed RNA polymerase subunit beta n=1 Tax=unclassified Enterococcus TaxID=2608891 RepID=UPI0009E69E6C|nr:MULTISPECIES: DNA-directed RNA polymerase subunit beta [unclassified Enterococcus]HCE12245.1 DNA-directed RNA polymerase subunit beta [Enterococcus sp.]
MNLNRYILTSLMKILLVILGAILLFIAGTMIGYGIIGDGSPFKVFSPSLWNHIFDFMK